jgi:Pro-kumamolisin, activation domain/Bacterial Ig-like domain (group 3)
MPRSSSALLPSLKLSTLVVCILIFSTASFAAPPDRVTAPIVAAQTVRLAAGVPMQARPEFDQGAVDPSLKMSMTLLTVPSASQQRALTKLLADQQNPGSASYHKWLTPEEYADRFGLSLGDVAKLTAWLQSQGFSVVETARGRNWIVFTGTAAQVEKSFQTQIHNFKANGQSHFANTTSPSIPAALSRVVVGVRGLNNFPAKSNAHRAQPGYTLTVGSNSFLFAAPGDIATIYDVNTLLGSGTDGTGQTLAVIGETDVYLDDLDNFRSGFNINAISGCTTNSTGVISSCSGGNFQYVFAEASGTDPGVPNSLCPTCDDLPEADIDLEWSNAVARNAKIAYVNAPLTGVLTAAYYAIDNTIAPVITMSYTSPCELFDGNIVADETELKKANSEGITFMNSSGDTGAAECDNFSITGTTTAILGYAVAYPASSPEVTGVGGTSIPAIDPNEFSSTYWNSSNDATGDGGSAKGYIPEQPWNDAEEFGLICSQTTPPAFCANFGITDWASAQGFFGISAGGGGVSNCFTTDANGVCNGGFPRPSWQAGIFASTIDPSGAGETTTPARYTPDVSLLASANFPGYIVCTAQSELGGTSNTSICSGGAAGITSMLTACVNGTGPCSIFGGTSVSSPVFAGMVTLLNQYLGASGLGNINPMLYSLAAANSTNKAFNSVITPNTGSFSDGAFCQPGTPTSGISGDPWPTALQCPTSGFLGFNAFDSVSTNGYNLVTGLGSVDFNNLAIAWAAARTTTTLTLQPSSTQITLGQSVTLTATASPASATGVVTFVTGSTTLGTATLTSGVAAISTTTLPVGADTITASYPGDGYNKPSTGTTVVTVTAPTFTFVSTPGTPTSHTVLSGQTTLNYSFTATPTSGSTFVNAVNLSCTSFSPTDPTLTSSSCTFSPSATIAAGAGASTVTMTIGTAGPNSGTGSTLRHRSDNRLPWLPLTLPLAGVVMVGFARRKMSRGATVAGMCLMLVLAGFLIACGSSSPPVSITSVTGSSSSIFPQNTGWTNATATFTAVLANDSGNKGVTWAVTTANGGSIVSADPTHGTYTPPTIAVGLPSNVTITATAVADTSKTGTASIALNPTTVPGTYTVTVTAAEAGATSQTANVTLVDQ